MRVITRFKSNNLFIWTFSNYFTHGLSFLTSILLARKLSPYEFGIWGSFLLISSFLNEFNLGITHGFLYKTIKSPKHQKSYLTHSSLLVLVLILILILLIFILMFFGLLKDYKNYIIYFALLSSSFSLINALLSNNARVDNKIRILAIINLLQPVGILSAVLLSSGENTIDFLLVQAIIIQIVIFLTLLKQAKFDFKKISKKTFQQILNKSLNLFLYNLFFYYVLICYREGFFRMNSVEIFGEFSFVLIFVTAASYFTNAFSFIINPKMYEIFKKQKNNSLAVMFSYTFLMVNICFMISIVIETFLPFFSRNFTNFKNLDHHYFKLFAIPALLQFCTAHNTFLNASNRMTQMIKSTLIPFSLTIISIVLYLNKTLSKELYLSSIQFSYFMMIVYTYWSVNREIKHNKLLEDKNHHTLFLDLLLVLIYFNITNTILKVCLLVIYLTFNYKTFKYFLTRKKISKILENEYFKINKD